jgi:hypothetical protein
MKDNFFKYYLSDLKLIEKVANLNLENCLRIYVKQLFRL